MRLQAAVVAGLAVTLLTGGAAMADQAERHFTLNGLDITLDAGTGAVRRMSYKGPGTLVEAASSEAGLVDVAYPLPEFEPLRLAARHSTGAVIEATEGRLVIRIDKLGPSRPGFKVEGAVGATVTFAALPDKRSVLLTCEVRNNTPKPIRQVVFPDLRGMVDVAGPDNTILKSCGFGSAPFRELVRADADAWYAQDSSTVEHKAGGMFSDMWGRWLDLGGLNGGLSLFPRRWGWDAQVSTVVQLQQATHRLRMLFVNPEEVPAGGTWHSPEWVLTPHRSGWAKGIEPYREWVRSHAKRQYPIPNHIRDGLGFRTLWMCQNQPADPTDAVWRFKDLPGLAAEAADHGLNEMVLWSVQPGFDASLPAPFPHLGTQDDLLEACRQARNLGVNVAPFISVLQANPRTAGRYGLTIPDNNGWTYHTEMVPKWNPPYATGMSCVQVGPANAAWQDEVAASCRRWADLGLPSVAWDQYWTGQPKPTMQDLTRRIRDYARTKDPESTFSGEELWNIEVDCEWLDYTWNWGSYRDCQAFINAFPVPRPNVNIDRSVSQTLFAFMDNLFLNVWPSKPDNINGSERISDVPALSQTLKRCARIRKQNLAYFTQGTFVGGCLLTSPTPGLRLTAYVLPDRILALALNTGAEADLAVHYELGPWVQGKRNWNLTRSSQDGSSAKAAPVPASGSLQTGRLANMEMALLEFHAD